MKKAIGCILLPFTSFTMALAQDSPIDFMDDTNDAEPAAPIDDYIGLGVVVAILLIILVVRLKITKVNLSSTKKKVKP